jgi:surface antigen
MSRTYTATLALSFGLFAAAGFGGASGKSPVIAAPSSAPSAAYAPAAAPVPATYPNNYTYKSVCPKPSGGRYSSTDADKWNFWKCECVSYVAYKLNARGIPFNNGYGLPKGQRWSDASNWLNAAKTAKVKVDKSPTVGSVATFTYGHVAFVEYVYKDGSIDISEYNYHTKPGYDFSVRTISKKDFSKITGFIHF